MFRTVPLSIIRSFLLYTQQWYVLHRFADSCEQDQDPDLARSCQQFHSKNKFEKLLYLFGFLL
jgi:hypothetical protein